ncbi:MAG: shikimate kinase [Desulfuromonadales bacterium]|nr:shikimate kinase [Desulfuromonadales bacterium]
MKQSNLTLIGMPGAGKSTVGIILAKTLGMGFVDTDLLIQLHQKKSLQQILDATDHLQLRAIEEREILNLELEHHVIATGGSAAYSDRAMAHLQSISTIVFLDVSYATLKKRINNFETRGIAKTAEQSFADLFNERQVLYRKYADLTFDGNRLNQDDLVAEIAASLLA